MIYLLIYAVGWLLCVRPAARWVLKRALGAFEDVDPLTAWAALFTGMFAACFWPLLVLAWLFDGITREGSER